MSSAYLCAGYRFEETAMKKASLPVSIQMEQLVSDIIDLGTLWGALNTECGSDNHLSKHGIARTNGSSDRK